MGVYPGARASHKPLAPSAGSVLKLNSKLVLNHGRKSENKSYLPDILALTAEVKYSSHKIALKTTQEVKGETWHMIQLTFSSNFYWNVCVKFCTLEQIIATVMFICIFSTNNKRSMLRFQSTTVPTNRGWSTCAVTGIKFKSAFLQAYSEQWIFYENFSVFSLVRLKILEWVHIYLFNAITKPVLEYYYWMRLLKFKWVATHQSNLYWKKDYFFVKALDGRTPDYPSETSIVSRFFEIERRKWFCNSQSKLK